MDEEIRRTIGRSETLQIDLHLYSDEKHPQDQAWGDMLVSLKGVPVWFTESEAGEEKSASWSWIDLLEFLGDKWPWLTMEEQYPIPINPLHPGTMRREAERRWENMPQEQFMDEDELLFHFEARHDLAMGLKGIFLPSLFVLRQGNKAWVSTNGMHIQLPFAEVIETLTELGDLLARRAHTSSAPRACRAVQRWQNRRQRAKDFFWPLRTGMGDELRSRLEGGKSPREFWEIDEESMDADNELFAAARLSAGIVTLEDQRALLQRIKKSPYCATPALDRTAEKAVAQLDDGMRPYEQGYSIAQAARHELGLSSDDRVDPESILRDWGVGIDEAFLDDSPLDAVAAWGLRHGPVIILNMGKGARPVHSHGRRSTLTHEICHLLLDRKGALPFSEALGGHTPLYVEQRARAFAAEFLLPREKAEHTVRMSSSLHEAFDALSSTFSVSIELAALQIKNSDLYAGLTEEEKGTVQRITEKHNLAGSG